MPDVRLFIYLAFFLMGFGITFQVLKASRLEEAFKKGKTTHIIIAYFIICTVVGHLVAEVFLRIISFIPIPGL